MVTVVAQLLDEALRHGYAAAHAGDIAQNPEKIVLNRGKKNRAPHAPIPWRRSSLLWRAKASSSCSSVTCPPAALEESIMARKAVSLASRSSTRRNPSRTTSLAEP